MAQQTAFEILQKKLSEINIADTYELREIIIPIILEAMEEYKNQPIVDKEQQAKLLSEIMQADEKDGLYEPVTNNHTLTAVEWLTERLTLSLGDEIKDIKGFFVIAKEMEKEQTIEDFINGSQWSIFPYDTPIDKIAEQYYNETYGSNL